MAGITWLHLSDWHQQGKDFNRQVVRDGLLEDIRNRSNIHADLERLDFLVFSGDVAFSGQAEEYQAAIEHLFEPVLEAAELRRDQLFIVPGNHDLDRTQFELLPYGLLHPFTSEEQVQDWLMNEKKLARFLDPFTAYDQFVSRYTNQDQPSYTTTRTFKFEDKQVTLLGLNSALMCGRNKNGQGEISDRGYLVVGEPQLHDALNQISGATIRIVVLHHPFEWLAEFDRLRVEERLGRQCHFILCGHEHLPKIHVVKGTTGDCIIIPAGASYDRRVVYDRRYVNAYNFVHIDSELAQGTICLRHWSDRQGKWASDAESLPPDGRWTFNLPKFRGHSPPVTSSTRTAISQAVGTRPLKEDWRDAPDASIFYGRQEDLAKLEQWVVNDRCRLVAILGMGGIGKTTLASKLVQQIKHHFDYVIWRSLRDAPPVGDILVELIQFLSDQKYSSLPTNVNEKVKYLVKHLSQKRCLLILDNVEEILQSGSGTGTYQGGYEGYGHLIRRIGDNSHQSCLIVTSREKPKEIAFLEGKTSPVRSLQLLGLKLSEGQKFLEDKDLFGSVGIWSQFINLYLGNPLALKLASESIRELFQGDIALFLKEGSALVGDIHHLLEEHFRRLSVLEQKILYWFAIEREPISVEDLRKDIVSIAPKEALLEALKSLRQRSLIEGSGAHFTLQPVIMGFMISSFVDQISKEIDDENIDLLESLALIKAQAKDYVRDTQVRLILKPVADELMAYSEVEIKKKINKLLSSMRMAHPQQSGYAAGNLLNLLVQLQFDLRGYNFSHLTIRQAYLQRVALPEINFAYANLETTSFTDTFGNIFSVAFSPDGEKIVAGTATGELRIWRTLDSKPLFTCQGHVNGVRAVAFSPKGDILASGGDDQTIRLWQANTGDHLHTLQEHSSGIRSIAFSPNGNILASGGDDQTVRFWYVDSGHCFKVLQEHTHRIMAVAFSPDGKLLASGSGDQTTRLWEISTNCCLLTLKGHTGWVRSISFSPKGQLIATAGDDQVVRIWEIDTGHCLRVLEGHTSGIRSIAFSPDGNVLASASEDQTVRIWQVETGDCLYNLLGHSSWVRSVAFSPDSQLIVSGGEDQTVRFWEINTGNCLHTLQGFTSGVRSVTFTSDSKALISGSSDQAVRIWRLSTGDCRYALRKHTNEVRSVAISSDDQLLSSGSTDQTVQIWQVKTGRFLYALRGHTNRVRSVAFSANRNILASASDDYTIRLWKFGPSSGQCLHILQGHTRGVRIIAFAPNGDTLASGSSDRTVCLWETESGRLLHVLQGHTDGVRTIAFSYDGQLIASSGSDQTICIWQVSTGHCIHILKGHTNRIRYVAFSPNGELLASASNDYTIGLWDVVSGRCLYMLKGHNHSVRSVAFSSDGKTLASGSDDQTIRLWDIDSGQCLYTLKGHTSAVRLVIFSPGGLDRDILASGSDDGTVRLWEVVTGKCLRILEGEKLCECMNITNAKGLTEAQRATLITLGAIEDEELVQDRQES